MGYAISNNSSSEKTSENTNELIINTIGGPISFNLLLDNLSPPRTPELLRRAPRTPILHRFRNIPSMERLSVSEQVQERLVVEWRQNDNCYQISTPP